MTRPQFTLRALLVAMLVVAAFFAGIRFERERRRREDEAMMPPDDTYTDIDVDYWPAALPARTDAATNEDDP